MRKIDLAVVAVLVLVLALLGCNASALNQPTAKATGQGSRPTLAPQTDEVELTELVTSEPTSTPEGLAGVFVGNEANWPNMLFQRCYHSFGSMAEDSPAVDLPVDYDTPRVVLGVYQQATEKAVLVVAAEATARSCWLSQYQVTLVNGYDWDSFPVYSIPPTPAPTYTTAPSTP